MIDRDMLLTLQQRHARLAIPRLEDVPMGRVVFHLPVGSLLQSPSPQRSAYVLTTLYPVGIPT
jgi:hypothetical protein